LYRVQKNKISVRGDIVLEGLSL